MCIQHNETDILGIHWEYIFILFSYNLNISQGLSFKKQIRFHLFSDSLKQYCLSDITIGLLMTPRAFEWVYVSFEWCLLLLYDLKGLVLFFTIGHASFFFFLIF